MQRQTEPTLVTYNAERKSLCILENTVLIIGKLTLPDTVYNVDGRQLQCHHHPWIEFRLNRSLMSEYNWNRRRCGYHTPMWVPYVKYVTLTLNFKGSQTFVNSFESRLITIGLPRKVDSIDDHRSKKNQRFRGIFLCRHSSIKLL